MSQKVISNFFDDTPLTKSHAKLIIIIAIAMVFEQADNYNFSFIAPVLREQWGLSVQQIGFINSLFATGMLVGTFVFGICSDIIGRKKTILVTAFIFSMGSLLNGLATNVEVFMVMRCITGIGISGLLIVAPSYMMEMLPSSKRGRMFGIATAFGFIGIPGIAVICNIVIPMGGQYWRIAYMVGSVGLLLVIFGMKWLKESPRWLVSKGRIAEAEAIVEEIVGEGYKADLSKAVITKNEKIPLAVIFKEIFNRKNRKSTVVLITLWSLILPAGLIFINFASTLLIERGFSMEQGLYLTSLLSVGMLIGPVITSVISDWGGRKIPIVVTALGLCVCTVLYSTTSGFTVMCITAVIFAALTQTITILANTYTPEMYPTEIRNAAVGVVVAIGRISNIAMMALFPAVYTTVGFKNAYYFLAVFYIVVMLVVGLCGKRTSGVSLENLNE